MNRPLVSIIVTCYNRADMVARALTSVWEQTYRPLELVIVDDGSKDNSMEVIQKWCEEHPDGNGFSRIAKTFPNGKLCVARNRGIEMSHGELIQYVDDDDWLYPFAIEEKVNAFLKDPSRDVVVNQVDYCYSDIGIRGHSHLTVDASDEKQLLHILNPENETYFSPTLMFRRAPLLAVGAWTPGLVFADDVDIVVRLAISGAKFGITDKSLSVYNMHGEWRQCNQVVRQLADTFWSDLFSDLYELCRKSGKDSLEVKQAFVKMIGFYASRLVCDGKFCAAENCYGVIKTIMGESATCMKYPKILRRTVFFARHFLYVCKRNMKKTIKRILGRG